MSPDKLLAELTRNGSQYRAFFDAIPEALVVVDAESLRVVDSNALAQRQYGYSRNEMAALSITDLSGEPEVTRESAASLRSRDHVFVLKRLHKRRDGALFPVEIHATTFFAGERRLILGTMRDISDRLLAHEALAESERRFRQMAAAITQVFWMTDTSKERIIYVSPGYESIWGRSCRSLFENPRSWLEAIVPEDRPMVVKALETQSAGGYDVRYRIARPDGEIRWIHDRGFPVVQDGAVTRVTGVAEDITEQVRNEAALREHRDFLESAQSVAGIGSWVWSVAEGDVFWSKECCRIMGVEPAARRKIEDFFLCLHPDDRPRESAVVDKALASGDSYSSEFRVVRADGQTRLIASHARVVRDAKGAVQRMIGVVRDVTDERQGARKLVETEAQLRQAQKMEAVGRLAGGVAHDFNNILTAILGLSDMAIRGLPPGSQLRADIEEIRASSQRAAGLTQQLLAFSRRQVIKPRPIELDDTIAGLTKMLRRIIGEDVELTVTGGAPGGVVLADPGQLEQLVMNLAVNARDAMPEGGRLLVTTCAVTLDEEQAHERELEPGEYVGLLVTDSGTGMSEEVRSHLFEPFFTTKTLGKGTGLGLATCYGIVRQNRGSIRCRSALGQGTTFEILLPREPGDAAPWKREENEIPLPTGSETVLVVEDEASVRRFLERSLVALGYQVLTAENGEDGLERVAQDVDGSIRLVVTDMVMPQLGGRRMAEILRELRPDLPVIFTTGYTDDMIGSMEIAPDVELIRKPFMIGELAFRMRALLDRPAANA